MKMVRAMTIFLLVFSCKSYDFPAVKNRDVLLVKNFALTYNNLIPDPDFKNLNMLGKVKKEGVYGQRLYGMILRSLRFKNITEKVERKYKLPENLLLAMIMHESGGVDLLPNSSDDGGIGLIHMQANMARKFGLTTFKNCDKLVCKEHGAELRKIIKEYNSDRKRLIAIDDRFHPILNIDAAARMLVYYRSGEQTKETPLKTAIYGYAGKYNYQKYYDNIEFYLSKLNDNNFLNEIEEDFNRQNLNLTLNGKPADFKTYIAAHQEQNTNYGLNEYN
ncbi:MAG: hypothetical protein U0W24_01090 [Bacteroidales bacterium]